MHTSTLLALALASLVTADVGKMCGVKFVFMPENRIPCNGFSSHQPLSAHYNSLQSFGKVLNDMASSSAQCTYLAVPCEDPANWQPKKCRVIRSSITMGNIRGSTKETVIILANDRKHKYVTMTYSNDPIPAGCN